MPKARSRLRLIAHCTGAGILALSVSLSDSVSAFSASRSNRGTAATIELRSPRDESRSVQPCALADFDKFVVQSASTPRGLRMPIQISAINVSGNMCTVGCRDNPVRVRILNAKGRLVSEISTVADGCPPDPLSADGVVQWPIEPGKPYELALGWDQGFCDDRGCQPARSANYIIEATWFRSDGTKVVTGEATIKNGPVCPKSAPSSASPAPWCTNVKQLAQDPVTTTIASSATTPSTTAAPKSKSRSRTPTTKR
jgi:hypothetical protein